MGPVESFVDDLKPNRVLYGVRAALLQRSLEIQPAFFTIRYTVRIVFCVVFCILFFQFFLCHMRAVRPPKAILVGKKMTWENFGEKKIVGIYQPIRAWHGRPPFWRPAGPRPKHTFSAFWLRSSVVSVLISLISGTWRMASQVIKSLV